MTTPEYQSTVEYKKLPDDVSLLFIEHHAWGNRKKASQAVIQYGSKEEDKLMFSSSKKLVDSKEYREINSYWINIKNRIERLCVPAFRFKSAYFVKQEKIEETEEILKNSLPIYKEKVKDFLNVYNKRIEEAEKKLGKEHFDRADYPTNLQMENRFYYNWQWLKVNVADNLPPEIRKKQIEKTKKAWDESINRVDIYLAGLFKDLIDNLAERLTPDENGKPKQFKSASVDNITEFIKTFQSRNIGNFTELESIMKEAEKRLVDPKSIRENIVVRQEIAENMGKIQNNLEKYIVKKKNRKFKF